MEYNFVEDNSNLKAKTSMRMRYEAEAATIRKQIGGLEEIRERMGISGHKLCQLLLVDPSAWSRWNKQGLAPPHVYRALQWFSLLEDKYPGLGPQTFLVDTGGARAQAELEKEIRKRMELEVRLNDELNRTQDTQSAQFRDLSCTLVQLRKQVRYLLFSLGVLACVLSVQAFLLFS